jgi:ribose transport system ATP-binding protein
MVVNMSEYILQISNIRKEFPGVVALDNISFDIKKGICHCIIGENGAGKSTLIKILMGALKRTSGTILYNGNEYSPHSTKDSMNLKISALFQELNIVDTLTVEQNLTLGRENTKFGFIKKQIGKSKVFDILQNIDPTIRPNQLVAELSFAKKQIVEIVKALASDAQIIIMDEPTAAISEEETNKLFQLITDLKSKGVTIIYISHRLDELFKIGDYITVLRDGRVIDTLAIGQVKSRNDLIKLMLGKIVVEDYIPNQIDYNVKVLEVDHLNTNKLKDISFELYKGEILGFYGLVGAGKSEIASAIYGIDKKSGTVKVSSKKTNITAPYLAIKQGLALIPEERRVEGLCTELAISDNIPMMNYQSILKYGITNKKKEKKLAREYIKRINIACRNENQITALLSGGNQQKVVFAKCLNAKSTVLLLDEPTRGVDVGAKQEVYSIIRQLSKQGDSIVLFSSELTEILNICDRIILLYEGEIKTVVKNDGNCDNEYILHIVTGGES